MNFLRTSDFSSVILLEIFAAAGYCGDINFDFPRFAEISICRNHDKRLHSQSLAFFLFTRQ